MKEEKVVENAASIGNEVLRPGPEALEEKHAIIARVSAVAACSVRWSW